MNAEEENRYFFRIGKQLERIFEIAINFLSVFEPLHRIKARFFKITPFTGKQHDLYQHILIASPAF